MTNNLPSGVTLSTGTKGEHIVTLDGDIYEGLSIKISPFLTDNTLLKLKSNGGLIKDAAEIADMVRNHKIQTWVPKNAICASSCFIIFAAGIAKNADETARIGVHGASTTADPQHIDNNMTMTVTKMYKILNIPPQIIGKMVITDPTDIIWLDKSDLQSMQVKIGNWSE